MCDRNRKILCLVAITREIRTGAVSVLTIVPWKGWSVILRGSSRTKAAARSGGRAEGELTEETIGTTDGSGYAHIKPCCRSI